MNERIKKQLSNKIKNAHNNRIAKLCGCKIKLEKINAIDFYKSIIKNKFNCLYDDLFYFILDRTIQWYYKWYYDMNNLEYEEYQNKIRFQMCNKELNTNQIYWIYLQQKKIYNFNLDIDKEMIVQYLKQCNKKTTGYENLI